MARCLNVLGRPACLAALLASLWIGGAAAHWQANLDVMNQVPPPTEEAVAMLEGATGVFTMWEGAAGTINWNLAVKGVTNMTMAHIHIGNATTSGDVSVFLVPVGEKPGKDGSLPMLDPPVTEMMYTASSSFKAKDVGGGLTLKELLALASTGGVYVNVHTTEYPGGAIRGQIMEASAWMSTLTPGNQVPTPLTEADVNGAAAKFTLTMVEGEDIYGYTLEVMDVENMTMAHIHAGNSTTNGGVVVILAPVGGMMEGDNLPMLMPAESGSLKFTGFFTNDDIMVVNATDFLDMLMMDPSSAFYVNVHTEAYPAGAIRGQLMTVNDMGDDMGGMEPSMEPSMAPEMAPTPTMAPTGGAGRIGFSMAALAAALAAMLL
ncbi:hypothetical protein ABPG77_007785 [Micractinium sp. CCAP 211/92]